MSHRLTRRRFLQSAAAVAAAAGVAPTAFAARAKAKPTPKFTTGQSPYKDLNVAFIGVAGRGGGNVDSIAAMGINVVALCDVDVERLARPAFRFANASTYADFREMLDTEKHIDAVVVSTPDHCHAPAALHAISLGKHVYCEKPLTHNVREARLMLEAARRHGVATQMGNQGHASEGSRVQVECIRAGAIGTVKEVHICTDRPIWPQGMSARPAETPAVPDTMHWDRWLGPAPVRAYNPAYLPFKWRGWWDFGTGALGDMGCHLMDAPYWALDLKDPVSLQAESGEASEECAPKWSIVTYEFPERNGRPPVKVVWYDGGKLPPKGLTGDHEMPDKNNFMVYVGNSGTLVAPLNGMPALVGDKDKKFKPPEKSIPRSVGHHEEFVIAACGGAPAGSNFEYSVPLTEMVLLGNLAIRSGRKVMWEAAKAQADAADANQYVSRPYRPGWEI